MTSEGTAALVDVDDEEARGRAFRSRLPTDADLAAGLAAVFEKSRAPGAELTGIERKPNVYASTFPSEIVTCHFAGGRELRVLCKYGPTDHVSGFGHRGGPARETLVYRRLLRGLRMGVTLYGAYSNRAGETWLVLQFLDGASRVHRAEDAVRALTLAAGWSGRFHAATDGVVTREASAYLPAYDASYYAAWARRTEINNAAYLEEATWFAQFSTRFQALTATLFADARVIIHGEFTPRNVLVQDRQVFPVDWESAAIGPGEIDLAGLTDLWPADLVDGASLAYQQARWPGGPPSEFDQRLLAARIYWNLRWLGDHPSGAAREKYTLRFEQLRICGEQLGLV